METRFLNDFPKVSGDITQTCREANTHGKTLAKEAGDRWEEKYESLSLPPFNGLFLNMVFYMASLKIVHVTHQTAAFS